MPITRQSTPFTLLLAQHNHAHLIPHYVDKYGRLVPNPSIDAPPLTKSERVVLYLICTQRLAYEAFVAAHGTADEDDYTRSVIYELNIYFGRPPIRLDFCHPVVPLLVRHGAEWAIYFINYDGHLFGYRDPRCYLLPEQGSILRILSLAKHIWQYEERLLRSDYLDAIHEHLNRHFVGLPTDFDDSDHEDVGMLDP